MRRSGAFIVIGTIALSLLTGCTHDRGKVSLPSVDPTSASPTTIGPTTTIDPIASEMTALGATQPIGYEGLPVPGAAYAGKPMPNDFCTGSGACAEQVFVLPSSVSEMALQRWYRDRLGVGRQWRNWPLCPAYEGAPVETTEWSWMRPGNQVLRLYVFAADADQPGPYVRITRGVEEICGDG
jgi:hypothetical protein